jgi:hypothetical protein
MYTVSSEVRCTIRLYDVHCAHRALGREGITDELFAYCIRQLCYSPIPYSPIPYSLFSVQ